jgi:hypothetical protein
VAGISSLSLTNSGEKIAIRNSAGLSIDSLTFSDSWFEGTYKADGGWTLERIDTSFTCFNRSNWAAAIHPSGGTPGKVNSIAAVFLDDDPPVPVRAFCPDPVSFQIVFSEPLEFSLIDSIDIDILSGIQVMNVSSAGGDNTHILASLSDSISTGITYRCLVSGARDCPGNLMSANQEIWFGMADSSQVPDVVINEVLFNPPDGGADFVELFNRGSVIADLTSFSLLSYDEETGLPDEVAEIDGDPWLLFPGEYAVLSESPAAVAAFYSTTFPRGFPEMDDIPAMNVDAGDIGILFRGNPADRFRYTEEDHFQLLNDFKGISLERIDPYRASGDQSNWHSASEPSGFATPGFRNSQFASGDSSHTEVVADPEVFSPDNDGVDDVVTFRVRTPGAGYIGSINIFHSEGRPVRELASEHLSGTEASYSWDGTTDSGTRAPMGIYIALLEFFTIEGTVQRYRVAVVLAGDL